LCGESLLHDFPGTCAAFEVVEDDGNGVRVFLKTHVPGDVAEFLE
jgi:hypothetical protein